MTTEEEQNEFIISIIAIIGLIFFIVFLVFGFDWGVNDVEMKKYFCEKEYGGEFIYKYDRDMGFGYCGKVTKNGTLIKYYFNDKDVNKYCKNKFWKLDDCENGLFR